jgi:hypothetical protein
MKIDKNGNLFAAGPGGIHVIAPDGTHLGSFETGVATGNCAWGDNGSSLFIAANTAILHNGPLFRRHRQICPQMMARISSAVAKPTAVAAGWCIPYVMALSS